MPKHSESDSRHATTEAQRCPAKWRPLKCGLTYIGIMAAVATLGVLIPAGLDTAAPGAPGAIAAAETELNVELWPSEVDFGNVQAGTRATTTVKLVNQGRRAVKLADVISTCGCTVASVPQEAIAPGGHAEVDVRMSVSDAVGRRSTKTLTFLFERSDARLKLPVSSTSAEFIRLSSTMVNPQATANDPLVLQSTDGRRFSIDSIQPAVFESQPTIARARHELHLDRERWKQSGSPRSVSIRTGHPEAPTLTVRIGTPRTKTTGQGQPAVAVTKTDPPAAPSSELQIFPQRVSFGMINSATSTSVARDVHIKGIGGDFADLEVESAMEIFAVEVLNVRAGDDGATVTLRVMAIATPDQDTSGPAIELPVMVRAAGREGRFTAYVSTAGLSP